MTDEKAETAQAIAKSVTDRINGLSVPTNATIWIVVALRGEEGEDGKIEMDVCLQTQGEIKEPMATVALSRLVDSYLKTRRS